MQKPHPVQQTKIYRAPYLFLNQKKNFNQTKKLFKYKKCLTSYNNNNNNRKNMYKKFFFVFSSLKQQQ